jgi:hypothetical protein
MPKKVKWTPVTNPNDPWALEKWEDDLFNDMKALSAAHQFVHVRMNWLKGQRLLRARKELFEQHLATDGKGWSGELGKLSKRLRKIGYGYGHSTLALCLNFYVAFPDWNAFAKTKHLLLWGDSNALESPKLILGEEMSGRQVSRLVWLKMKTQPALPFMPALSASFSASKLTRLTIWLPDDLIKKVKGTWTKRFERDLVFRILLERFFENPDTFPDIEDQTHAIAEAEFSILEEKRKHEVRAILKKYGHEIDIMTAEERDSALEDVDAFISEYADFLSEHINLSELS